ncbi:hypothetical protein GCM10011507_35110 [Edaphobacter acidisoli]|uniref:Uncharacterized protein n=1 Tax=Edaphobacter acidisoli TaxID=2040573 RepID=A0A916S2L6_9BACT|nr:hypothetical protein [Edaphobacter acidisoli]GGA80858.1 hypothetical protein GCM10011507_35110 [Edaphobacter acidisoli]
MRKAFGCMAIGFAFVYFAAWADSHYPAWWAFPSVLLGVVMGACFLISFLVSLVEYADGD